MLRDLDARIEQLLRVLMKAQSFRAALVASMNEGRPVE